jgi:hypothetical protein
MSVETRIVNNAVFVLGLDDLFRDAMKAHERTELLDAAKATADTLSVFPADVPIEGYYNEDEELTQYFQFVRALQNVPKYRESELKTDAGFARLKQVTGSPIFGPPSKQDSILPAGNDCLTDALQQTFPSWNIQSITKRAFDIAVESDDFSLVALAALSFSSVVLAALRESVVLYARIPISCAPTQEHEYVWQVDQQLASRAALFVDEFNTLFDASLPAPDPSNAKVFWDACKLWGIIGRCVRIGFDDSVRPARQYHWAIDHDGQHNLLVKDFWDTEIWTTSRYRETNKIRL